MKAPDRPIILGSVYNDNNVTPFQKENKANPSISGIMTHPLSGEVAAQEDFHGIAFTDPQGQESAPAFTTRPRDRFKTQSICGCARSNR